MCAGCRLDQPVDGLVETSEPFAHVQDFGDAVRECDLLSLVLEIKRLHPPPPRVLPGSAFVWLTQTTTEQMIDQSMFGPTLVRLRGAALAYQIAHGLKVADLAPSFGDGRRDGFSLNIETQISSTMAQDRLLRCGSAPWFCYRSQA
jgi:hypothetical protein